MSVTWKSLREELDISQEDENIICLEKELIRTLVSIREEKGLSQAELAKACKVKQPLIARLETGKHSPQVNSLLKILTPLGYTLQITPIKKRTSHPR